jgi:hypothetical protein
MSEHNRDVMNPQRGDVVAMGEAFRMVHCGPEPVVGDSFDGMVFWSDRPSEYDFEDAWPLQDWRFMAATRGWRIVGHCDIKTGLTVMFDREPAGVWVKGPPTEPGLYWLVNSLTAPRPFVYPCHLREGDFNYSGMIRTNERDPSRHMRIAKPDTPAQTDDA